GIQGAQCIDFQVAQEGGAKAEAACIEVKGFHGEQHDFRQQFVQAATVVVQVDFQGGAQGRAENEAIIVDVVSVRVGTPLPDILLLRYGAYDQSSDAACAEASSSREQGALGPVFGHDKAPVVLQPGYRRNS